MENTHEPHTSQSAKAVRQMSRARAPSRQALVSTSPQALLAADSCPPPRSAPPRQLPESWHSLPAGKGLEPDLFLVDHCHGNCLGFKVKQLHRARAKTSVPNPLRGQIWTCSNSFKKRPEHSSGAVDRGGNPHFTPTHLTHLCSCGNAQTRVNVSGLTSTGRHFRQAN